MEVPIGDGLFKRFAWKAGAATFHFLDSACKNAEFMFQGSGKSAILIKRGGTSMLCKFR